jgi:serine/threonine-protein kinase
MLDARDLLGQRVGGSQLDRLLGLGASRWVFAGRPLAGAPPVAVKVLNPRYADDGPLEERFRREASVARRLAHPNVVPILDEGRDGDLRYYTMPLYPASLGSLIGGGRTVDEVTAVRIGRDVAWGLAVAHRAGLVHRDVKPANILIDDHGSAVISDFGIARPIAPAVRDTEMTLGTPLYISPEQAQGLPPDGRADIYALGVALYRATTGHAPFHANDWFALARMHVEQAPTPPRRHRPALSPTFEQVIVRCLGKRPDDRYPTAEALADALVPGSVDPAAL